MMMTKIGILLLFFSGVAASRVTPIQKCIQMLSDMAAKGKQEKQEESVRFAAFSQWCDNTRAESDADIKQGNARIEQLTAEIAKANADASQLGDEINALAADLAKNDGELQSAQNLRDKEHADFQQTHTDFSESIDALSNAIGVLKSQPKKVDQSLLQLRAILAKKSRVLQFLSDPDADFLARSGPEASAYEFQSGGVIDMLEKLKDKFVQQRRDLEKDELRAKHSFQMVAQDLTDQIKAATDSKNKKAGLKGKREEDSAGANGDLKSTKIVLDQDVQYLKDTEMECSSKSRDYESRQSLRAGELDAIAKAIEILSSGAVSGHGSTYLPSFLQLRRGHERAINVVEMQKKASELLLSRAKGNRFLAMIAQKVADDPFAKVTKMIKNLITRLQEEANTEASHKGWCDAELAKNKTTREQLTSDVDSLRANEAKAQALANSLAKRVSELTDEVAELDASVNEATAQRSDEKAKNAVTVKDAKEGQEAVAQAISVLQEFYQSSADSTALVQAPADDAPATFDKPYQGMQAESGGVIGMLQVIQSDFVRLESETVSEESAAASEFEKFKNESATVKAVKETEIRHTARNEQKKRSKLANLTRDKNNTQDELDASNDYYDSLKPSCVDSGLSYEERVQKRREEIESLKEALQILA